MTGIKADGEKLDWTLLDFKALSELVQVAQYGRDKYARDNWRHVPDAPRRYLAACVRHLMAYASGERYDSETGLSHLGHVGWNVMALLALEEHEVTNVDRYRGKTPKRFVPPPSTSA